MPTYEYRCSNCGHKFEKFQSITAAPLKRCPACNKDRAQRLIGTGAGLIFKGSGFYITDYRSEGYKEKAKAESGSSESKTGDSTSKETKSPEKSEAATPAKAEQKAAATHSKPQKKSAPKKES
jgi:putative FmdB family regulatory protein